jgi:hypothetical protein
VPKIDPVTVRDPSTIVGPTTLRDPERVISYVSRPVKASMDWVTCHVSTVFPVVIPDLDKILAIYFSL